MELFEVIISQTSTTAMNTMLEEYMTVLENLVPGKSSSILRESMA